MKTKAILSLIVAFLLGFLGGATIKYVYEASTFKQYYWTDAPVVINCYGKEFSEGQLLRGVEFWALRTHQISFYEHNPSEKVCANEFLEGFIILRKVEKGKQVDDDLLAVTSRRTTGLTMRSAVIWFKPGSQNLDLIIEHEMGHAFGYGHVEVEGHLMHPTYDKMTSDFWIP